MSFLLSQLVGEREVRAVVKLKFRDISGTSVVCHRMLQSTQKVGFDKPKSSLVSCTCTVYRYVVFVLCCLPQAKKIEQRSLDSSLEKVIAGVVS